VSPKAAGKAGGPSERLRDGIDAGVTARVAQTCQHCGITLAREDCADDLCGLPPQPPRASSLRHRLRPRSDAPSAAHVGLRCRPVRSVSSPTSCCAAEGLGCADIQFPTRDRRTASPLSSLQQPMDHFFVRGQSPPKSTRPRRRSDQRTPATVDTRRVEPQKVDEASVAIQFDH
jgi:hypothetical protein